MMLIFTPGNSLELTYVSAPGGDWYSEIQYCPVRGNDFFREPSTLSMQVRLSESMNAAALPNIAIRYADSTYTQYLNLRNYLKDTRPGVWHSVSIPLKDFGLNAVNDTNIKKLAAVALRPGTADGNEYTIYLDDIELLPASLPSVSALNAPVLQEAKAVCASYRYQMDSSIEGGYKILSHLPFFRRDHLPAGRCPPPLDESLY